MSDGAGHAPQSAPSVQLRQVAAVAAGNGIAVYDFLIYALFAAEIGRTFFPGESETASLLASLAAFGVGFLMRPLGAIVIGRIADRSGRRTAMQLSFILMGIAMLGLAASPGHAEIGVAAPVLVVLFRLMQGFALGGELGPSTAFLVEVAPAKRRGLYVSVQYFSQDVGIVAAGMVSVALATLLTAPALEEWGWRLAFLLGAAILPIGYGLRRSLPETLPAKRDGSTSSGPPRRLIVCGLLILAGSAVVTYVTIYVGTYASSTLGLPSGLGFVSTVTLGLCGLVCSPLGGWLSDRLGRKRIMIGPWLLLLVAAFPGFHLVVAAKTLGMLVAWTALVGSCAAIAITAALAALAEGLPPSGRSRGLGLIYAFSVAVFGGSTQFVVAWLDAATGNPTAPAWYMTGAAAIAALAMMAIPETARPQHSSTMPRPDREPRPPLRIDV